MSSFDTIQADNLVPKALYCSLINLNIRVKTSLDLSANGHWEISSKSELIAENVHSACENEFF